MPKEPEIFYQYIKDYSTDPELLLTPSFNVLLNRLEFCTNFDRHFNLKNELPYIVDDRGFGYIKEVGGTLTESEEEQLKQIEEQAGEEIWITRDSLVNIYTAVYEAAKRNGLSEQQISHIDSLTNAGNPTRLGYARAWVRNMTHERDAITDYFGTEDAPLWWQMGIANRTVATYIIPEDIEQSDAFDALDKLEANGVFCNEGLKSALRDYYLSAYKPFELPDDAAGRLVKEMIAHHKGKYILMDLWATSCGPCRVGISNSKKFRMRNLDNPDFASIFVTDESLSPRKDYEEFAAENFVGEDSHYLSNENYNLLRELFGFNGIPRYVLFDREGKVISKSFPGYETIAAFLRQNGATVLD